MCISVSSHFDVDCCSLISFELSSDPSSTCVFQYCPRPSREVYPHTACVWAVASPWQTCVMQLLEESAISSRQRPPYSTLYLSTDCLLCATEFAVGVESNEACLLLPPCMCLAPKITHSQSHMLALSSEVPYCLLFSVKTLGIMGARRRVLGENDEGVRASGGTGV